MCSLRKRMNANVNAITIWTKKVSNTDKYSQTHKRKSYFLYIFICIIQCDGKEPSINGL